MKKKKSIERLPDDWYFQMHECVNLDRLECINYPWLGRVIENLATNIDNAMYRMEGKW